MKDADPPRYEARRATSWLVLFMTHIASCGAGAVIKNTTESGESFIDDTDPNFRQKLAKRLGMKRHQSDVEAIRATRAAGDAEAEAADSGSGSSGESQSSDDDESEELQYMQKYNGVNFRVDDHNTKRFEKACDDYKAASIKVAGLLRTACADARLPQSDPIVEIRFVESHRNL